MTNVDYIVPISYVPEFRAQGRDAPHRLNAILFSIEHFIRRQSNVIVNMHIVEQDVGRGLYFIPNIERSTGARDRINLYSVSHPTFNKGWLYNVAFRNSNSSHVFFAESDVYCRNNFMEKFLGEVDHAWSFAWSKLYYLDHQNTELIVSPGEISLDHGKQVKPEPKYSEGGIVYMRRKFFEEIGGYNEWLQGLGGPDNEIILRAKHRTGTYPTYANEIFHLWHPKIRRKGDPTRERNKKIISYVKKHPKKVGKFLSALPFGGRAPLSDRGSFWQNF